MVTIVSHIGSNNSTIFINSNNFFQSCSNIIAIYSSSTIFSNISTIFSSCNSVIASHLYQQKKHHPMQEQCLY